MKTYFDFTLKGKNWAGPFIVYWIAILLLYTPFAGISVISRRAQGGMVTPLVLLLVDLVLVVAVVVLAAVFAIVFLRIFLPKLSIKGNAFSFKGSIGKYLGLNVGGILLTIVTLSIYFPWYVRRITAYLVSETSFNGSNPEFMGKGGRLFTYYLLCVLVPFVVVGILIAVVFAVMIATGSLEVGLIAVRVLSALMGIVVFLILIPWIYLVYKWYVNIRWNDVTIAWKTSFWPSCGFILGQVLLIVITATIYWPAGFLRIYGYFVGKTVLSKGEAETGRLGFDGSLGKGFGLLWGQALLSIITLGVYIPWAYANIGRWLMSATYHQESAAAPTA
jgi:uncharacterized membrane protein YjgN (DUF898 family)